MLTFILAQLCHWICSISYPQTQLLEPQCKPNWRRCGDLPVGVSNAHLVKMEDNIYCSGVTGKVDTSRLVFKYDTTRHTWSSLPPCPTRYHGLSEVNGRLVSIGGVKYDAPLSTPTNSVYKFQKSKWVTALPPMHTARFDLSAFTYKTHLFVCGGVTSWTSVRQFTCTSAVEMFISKTRQWSILAPLPLALHLTSIVITDNTCYVLGGEHQGGTTNRAYFADLDLHYTSVLSTQDECPLILCYSKEYGTGMFEFANWFIQSVCIANQPKKESQHHSGKRWVYLVQRQVSVSQRTTLQQWLTRLPSLCFHRVCVL